MLEMQNECCLIVLGRWMVWRWDFKLAFLSIWDFRSLIIFFHVVSSMLERSIIDSSFSLKLLPAIFQDRRQFLIEAVYRFNLPSWLDRFGILRSLVHFLDVFEWARRRKTYEELTLSMAKAMASLPSLKESGNVSLLERKEWRMFLQKLQASSSLIEVLDARLSSFESFILLISTLNARPWKHNVS